MKTSNALLAAPPAAIAALIFFVMGQVLVRALGPGWDEMGAGLAGFAAIAAVLIAVNRMAREAAEKQRSSGGRP